MKFCAECGKKVADPGEKFCPECGSPLSEKQAQPAQAQPAQGRPAEPGFFKKYGGWMALAMVILIGLPLVLLAQYLTDDEVSSLRKQELKAQQLEAAANGLTAASDLKMFEASMMSDAQAMMALQTEYDAVAASNFTGKADVSAKAADAILALDGNTREISIFLSQNEKALRGAGANATRLSVLTKAIGDGLPKVAANISGELTAMAKGDPNKLAYINPTVEKLKAISSGAN